MRICVTYDELCTHSHHSGEQYGDWSESYSSSVTGAYRIGDDDQAPYESETFLVPDDATEVFVVYMIYDTGDSFGHADGKISIIHCTVSEEAADKLAKTITEKHDEFTIKFTDDFDREISLYNPGAGYFESISYVGIERYDVGSGKSQRRYYVN
jgi:hypothetical protein